MNIAGYGPNMYDWFNNCFVEFGIAVSSIVGFMKEYSILNQVSSEDLIQGNPIAQYVIDRNHTITHFNAACEKLTGLCADQMIGSSMQWRLYFKEKAHTLADLIIDGLSEEKITGYDDVSIRKSPSGERCYEAEYFIPWLGEKGLWLQVTTISIHDKKGNTVGAIETLLDITEKKKAVRELIESKLRISEEKYRQLFNNANDAIMLHKLDAEGMPGEFIEVNDTACLRLEYSREELLGMSPADIDDKYLLHKISDHAKVLLRTGHSVFETVHITKNGRKIPVEISTQIFVLNGKKVVMSIARDITERKRIEEDLKRQKAYFKQLFDNSPQGFIMVDKDNSVIEANKGFEAILGYSTNEINGTDLDDLVLPHNLVLEGKNITKRGLNGEIVELETVRLRKDGTLVEVSILSFPVILDGKQVGAYVVYTDISRRKDIERKLRESEEIYKKLVELSPDSIFIMHDYCIEFVNSTGIKLLGADSPDQLLGQSVLRFIHPDYVEATKDRISLIKTHSQTVPPLEQKLLRVDGTAVDVETAGTSVHYKESNYLLVYVRNITERKRLEGLEKSVSEKEQMLREAQEYERIRSEFFANLSHELRTPIHIVFASTQVLEMYLRDSPSTDNLAGSKKQIRIMKQNIYRLIRLINNLIDITKIEAQYFDLCLTNCDIVKIVEDITLSAAEYTGSKGIELLFDTDVEEKITACDPDKIERIMLNLLSNAIKFTQPGGQIWVDMHDMEDHIQISVRDTGIGIPPDKIDIIFERFRQADQCLSRIYEGSGIGLSLVKSIVEMHNGQISVKSHHGRGTEFTVKLPVELNNDKEKPYRSIESRQDTKTEVISIELSDIYSVED